MTAFELVIDLPTSPADSWAFVVGHGSEIEPLKFEPRGAQGVGMLNDLSGRLLGIPFRGVSSTVAWDAPNKCVFESVKPAWPIRSRITETFTASGGGTQHRIHYDVTPVGTTGRLAAPVFCALMKRNRRTYQARLRSALRRVAAGG